MFRNRLLELIGAPLLVPLVFAYLVALVLAIVELIRCLAGSGDAGSDDQP